MRHQRCDWLRVQQRRTISRARIQPNRDGVFKGHVVKQINSWVYLPDTSCIFDVPLYCDNNHDTDYGWTTWFDADRCILVRLVHYLRKQFMPGVAFIIAVLTFPLQVDPLVGDD